MLSHKVIIHKPLISYQSYQTPKRLTQEEYDEFLKTVNFKVGAVVTLMSAGRRASALMQCHKIVKIEESASNLQYTTHGNHPKFAKLLSLDYHNHVPWTRWDYINDTHNGYAPYRYLTEEETQQLIEPHNAGIQSHCQRYEQANPV